MAMGVSTHCDRLLLQILGGQSEVAIFVVYDGGLAGPEGYFLVDDVYKPKHVSKLDIPPVLDSRVLETRRRRHNGVASKQKDSSDRDTLAHGTGL